LQETEFKYRFRLSCRGCAVNEKGGDGMATRRDGKSRPNILLLVSDQERNWTDLPDALELQAHERLRGSGTAFRNYNVHTTPCSPSRSTMYTGRHTQHTRMVSNHGAPPFPELPEGMPTLGHMLRGEGYYTAYKGKWHLSGITTDDQLQYGRYRSTRGDMEPFGFADYNFYGDPHGVTWTGYRYDPAIASDAAHWLRTRGVTLAGEARPWLLCVNFVNPHDVMFFDSGGDQSRTRLVPDLLGPLAPSPSGGAYGRYWDVPLPRSFSADSLAGKPWIQRAYVDFCNDVYGRMRPEDEEQWLRLQSYYFNCIRDVDRNACTVLEALDQAGLADRTVVVLTADHGEMAGAHGMRQKGPHVYRENVGVPLIVSHPDVGGGGTTEALGGPIDLAPTLLAFAGRDRTEVAGRHPELAGVDLSPVVADPRARTERDRRGLLYNYSTQLYIDPDFTHALLSGERDARPSLDKRAFFRGVHDGRYKFARYFAPSDHHRPEDWNTLATRNDLELYDTREDPDELVNLAQDPDRRDLVLELNARVNALIDREVGADDGSEHPAPLR